MQFEVGDIVNAIFLDCHGIILECLPYEYDEDDLDDDMVDDYKVYLLGRDETIYIRATFITKEC